MSTIVKTPTFCIHVYAKTKAQISIAVSAKLISAFVFAVLKLPSYGKVIITILNVRVACLFVVGLCSNFIKKLVLKSAIRSMLNCLFLLRRILAWYLFTRRFCLKTNVYL